MKLIIADLDGTLMHHQKFSQETLDMIKKIQDHGHMFSLATGRHKNAVSDIVKKLDIKIPVICSNGAFIYDFNKQETIEKQVLSDHEVNHVIDLLLREELDFLVYTTKEIVATHQAKTKLESYIGSTNIHMINKDDYLNNIHDGVVKILLIEENEDRIRNIKNELKMIDELYVLQSRSTFLDIGPKKANKGLALRFLADYLQIPLDDCIAIGDQENDIEMIKTAKIGIAMGNSEQEVKDSANYVTESVDQNGFANIMNQLLFEGKE